MNALELAAFNGQVARLGRAGANHDGVEFLEQAFGGIIFSDFRVREECDAFLGHEINAALDDLLVELHVGNAVHEQAADTVAALKNRSPMAAAAQLRPAPNS